MVVRNELDQSTVKWMLPSTDNNMKTSSSSALIVFESRKPKSGQMPTMNAALALLSALLLCANATSCTNDESCSLNGVCTSGACLCDQGWTGAACQTLDIVSGEKDYGYRLINDPKWGNTSSWGGGGWYDQTDQKFYIWATELQGHCGALLLPAAIILPAPMPHAHLIQ